jgi:hypothetical protein
MTPFILAAAVTLNIDLSGLIAKRFHAQPEVRNLTCGIETVSYKFVGDPGTKFRYAGDTYVVPQSGSIELLASRADEYQIDGRALPLNVWPKDAFGMRTVPLPHQQ